MNMRLPPSLQAVPAAVQGFPDTVRQAHPRVRLILSVVGIAIALGLVWIVGRILYFIGYRRAVDKRIPGFFVQAFTCLVLFVAAVVGVIRHLAAG